MLKAIEEQATAETNFSGRHRMDSPEWYTPSSFIEAARLLMGTIDLDPASCEEANKRVQATRYFGEHENGLLQPWSGCVFLNPPGGLVAEFWLKALAERANYEQLVWIGYSLEQLQTLQQIEAERTPLDLDICFTSKRIAFVENEAKKALRIQKILTEGDKPNASLAKQKAAARIRRGKEPVNSPSHSNYITYIGAKGLRFAAIFEQFGQVRFGY